MAVGYGFSSIDNDKAQNRRAYVTRKSVRQDFLGKLITKLERDNVIPIYMLETIRIAGEGLAND